MRALAILTLWLAAAALSAADSPPLKLSLQEATRRALEHNTTLAVERQSDEQAAAAVNGARGAYDILWNADFGWRKNTDPINSVFSGAPPGLLAPENESVEPAREHAADDIRLDIPGRKCRDRQRGQRRAAHRIDVADRIRRRSIRASLL